MIKKKTRGNLIVISGPSGCGKGTICEKVLQENNNIMLSVSMTTRKPRAKEKDGVDYYFVSKEEFEKRIKDNKFLEFAKVHNDNYYGTPKDKVEEALEKGVDVILEIDIQGAKLVNELMKEAIFIFIMPPNMRELKRRLIARNTETKEQIVERFKKAYQEINEVSKYNYIVINDDLELAVKKVESILLSERCRVDRIDDIDLNNKEELLHELLMEDFK